MSDAETKLEGVEEIWPAVEGIQIEGPGTDRGRHLAPDVAAAVRDAKRDLPAPEPLTAEEVARRSEAARAAAQLNDPLWGKTIIEDDTVMTVVDHASMNTGTGGHIVSDAKEPALFDNRVYIDVPEIDGQATDKLVIAFSGSISYDASDEAGKALFARLTLGHEVELRVAGTVTGKDGKYKVTAREEEVVTGKATVKVDTLYLLTAEQLD